MRLLYYLAIVLITACNSNTILKKPKNLISQDKMVAILTESYIARNTRNVQNINGTKHVNYLSMVYQNQNIDSTTFNSSLQYYVSNIRLHEEILKRVRKNINQKLQLITAQQKNTLP